MAALKKQSDASDMHTKSNENTLDSAYYLCVCVCVINGSWNSNTSYGRLFKLQQITTV